MNWSVVLAALFAAISATACGYMVMRTSRAANANTASQGQLAWVQQAQSAATDARTRAEAAEERLRKNEGRMREQDRRMDEQERHLRRNDAQLHDLVDWVGRVMARANEVDVNAQSDSKVIALMRAINGGPASMSNDRIHTGR